MAQRLPIEYVRFYTEGSAAKKLDVVVPVQKPMLAEPYIKAAPIKRKKVYVDPLAIFGVVVAICMMITIFVGVQNLRKTQDDLVAMERYVAHLRQENAVWKDKYADAYELEEIERTALALGMVPAEQVTHHTIVLDAPAEEPEPGFFENIGTFLTGLFA